jgi:hypothetical protein
MVAFRKPLRIVALAAAMAVGGSSLAWVIGGKLPGLPSIKSQDVFDLLHRVLGNSQRLQFGDASNSDEKDALPMPSSHRSVEPEVWLTTVDPLTRSAVDEVVAHLTPPDVRITPSIDAPALSRVSTASLPPPASKIELPAQVPSRWISDLAPQRPLVVPSASPIASAAPGAARIRPATNIDVGISSTAASMNVGPGERVETNDLRVGVNAGSSGAVVQTGGTVKANRVVIGQGGSGFYDLRGGTLGASAITIGENPQSRGVLHVGGGQVALTGPGAKLVVGDKGDGVLLLGQDNSPGRISADTPHAASAATVVVRAAPSAKGVISGYGEIKTGGTLINNGRIIADGGGQSRSLDLSSFARIDNTIDNPPTGTAGWYARAGGTLTLPPLTVRSGTSTITWGERNTDTTLDLVNSLRVTVHNQLQAGSLSISLTSDQSTAPVAQLIGRPVTLYRFSGARNTAASYNLTIRYNESAATAALVDAATASDMSSVSSQLKLYAYDGRWVPANYQLVDSDNKLISGAFTSAVNYVAVAVPIHAAINNALAPVIIARDDFVVPEPTTLLAPLAAMLLMRRRRR